MIIRFVKAAIVGRRNGRSLYVMTVVEVGGGGKGRREDGLKKRWNEVLKSSKE